MVKNRLYCGHNLGGSVCRAHRDMVGGQGGYGLVN